MILIPLLLILSQQTTAPAFITPRVLLSVNDRHIHSDEVNELVNYYRTYRSQDSTDSLIRRAIVTLIPQKLMHSVLASEAKELEMGATPLSASKPCTLLICIVLPLVLTITPLPSLPSTAITYFSHCTSLMAPHQQI
jgi:hypothetical protein